MNRHLGVVAAFASIALSWGQAAIGRELAWTGQDLRRVHTVFVSPPWAENRGAKFDPRGFVRELKAAGVGAIEFMMKDHYGNAYFRTSSGSFFGRDLLTPLVEESHAQGIKLFAYYSVGLDSWAYENHRQWRRNDFRRSEAQRNSGFLFEPVDVQSGYLDYMLNQIGEIAQAPVDGWFLDVCCEYYGNANIDSLRRIYETIRQRRPESLITWNGSGGFQEELNGYSDFFSNEGWHYDQDSSIAKFLRRSEKPFTLESPGGYVGLSWGTWALKPPVLLQLEGAVVSAHGGALAVGLNPLADGTIKPAEIENLSSLWRFIQERETYFIGTKAAAEIALMLPPQENADPQDDGRWQDKSYWRSVLSGLHAALMDYQCDFGVVMPQSELERYQLVIVPSIVSLDEAAQERVRQFVAGGGKLLMLGGSVAGLHDVLGLKASRAEVFPYTALFAGLRATDLRRNMPDYPVMIRGGASRVTAATGTSLAKVIVPVAEHTPVTAFGFGYNPPGSETQYDMIVRNRYERGEAVYVAGSLSEDLARSFIERNGAVWLKQLMANIIDMIFPNPLIKVEATPGIEVVTNWQGNRMVVNLINYHATLPGRYGLGENRLVKARDTRLFVNEARFGMLKKATLQPGGQALAWERDGSWLQIKVPEFSIHTFVILEGHVSS